MGYPSQCNKARLLPTLSLQISSIYLYHQPPGQVLLAAPNLPLPLAPQTQGISGGICFWGCVTFPLPTPGQVTKHCHKVAHWVSRQKSKTFVQGNKHLTKFFPKFPLSNHDNVTQEHLLCSFLKEATHKTFCNPQAEVRLSSAEIKYTFLSNNKATMLL